MSTDPNHPYSDAVEAAGLVFVSGSLPFAKDRSIVPGGRAALDAAIDTMVARLATVGAALGDVVKLTYFVTDIRLRDVANEQFLDLWQAPRPARSVVGVSELPYGSVVEIDAVARKSADD